MPPPITARVLRYPPPDRADEAETTEPDSVDAAMDRVFGRLRGTPVTGTRNVREGATFVLRGYYAEVDLSRCEILVSSNRNHPTLRPERRLLSPSATIRIPDEASRDGYTQRLCTTEDWARSNGTTLATNANFFQIQGDVHTQEWTRTDGLSLSEGVFDQEPVRGDANQKGTVCLLFRRDGTACIRENYQRPGSGGSLAVARSSSAIAQEEQFWNGVAGNWLVRDGATSPNLGPDPNYRHARLAAGVIDGGRRLAIVMFELQTAVPRPPYKLFSCRRVDQGRDTILGYDTLLSSLPPLPDIYDLDSGAHGSAALRGMSEREIEQLTRAPIPRPLADFMNAHAEDLMGAVPLLPSATACLCNAYASRWKVFRNAQPDCGEVYLITKRSVDGVETLEFFDISDAMLARRRGEDVSVGVTLDELARLMMELGIRDAVNLDGSGSSSFVYTPAEVSQTLCNSFHDEVTPSTALSPTDPSEMRSLESFLKPRPSGNHMGFRPRPQ